MKTSTHPVLATFQVAEIERLVETKIELTLRQIAGKTTGQHRGVQIKRIHVLRPAFRPQRRLTPHDAPIMTPAEGLSTR